MGLDCSAAEAKVLAIGNVSESNGIWRVSVFDSPSLRGAIITKLIDHLGLRFLYTSASRDSDNVICSRGFRHGGLFVV